MVSTGVSPDHGQLPGFSTFTIDKDLQARDVTLTSLDITSTYG